MDYNLLKLYLLAICWLLCLGTLWTSPSFRFDNPNMGKLKPNMADLCRVARNERSKNHCDSDSSTPSTSTPKSTLLCKKYDTAVTKCENAVKYAYQYINLGGCPYEIRSTDLCEAEWCTTGSNNFNFQNCQKECATVRQSLVECTTKLVQKYFKRYGLNDDGSLSVSPS